MSTRTRATPAAPSRRDELEQHVEPARRLAEAGEDDLGAALEARAAAPRSQTSSASGFRASRRSKPPTTQSSSRIFGQKVQASVHALVRFR